MIVADEVVRGLDAEAEDVTSFSKHQSYSKDVPIIDRKMIFHIAVLFGFERVSVDEDLLVAEHFPAAHRLARLETIALAVVGHQATPFSFVF